MDSRIAVTRAQRRRGKGGYQGYKRWGGGKSSKGEKREGRGWCRRRMGGRRGIRGSGKNGGGGTRVPSGEGGGRS